MFDSKLLREICDAKAVFWAGQFSPTSSFTSSTRIFDEKYDFRQPSSDHGSYSAVYLTEIDLGIVKQWPIILDEALRLLAHDQKTLLFIRFSQSHLLSIFALSAFLRKKKDFNIRLNYQDQDQDGTVIYSLECHRTPLTPSLSTFEFALITNGLRPAQVRSFVDSVANIRGIDNITWSIAICGPAEFRYQTEALSNRIRYIVEPSQHTAKGWITRKKNLIVETSSSENLLVAHDRYEIPENFLDAMFEYGPDFSVLVPAQIDQEGKRFPDWVSIGSQWSWAPCGMLDYGDYNPNIYINGGVIISKKNVLIDTPWNDLLFWNQGEDVELSRCLADDGIIPRLSRIVTLTVTDARPGYTFDFASLPSINNAYVSPHGSPLSSQFNMGVFCADTSVDLKYASADRLAILGITASKDYFSYTSEGLIPKRNIVDIAFGVKPTNKKDFKLSLNMKGQLESSDIELYINGKPVAFACSKDDYNSVCISLSVALADYKNCRNIFLTLNSNKNYILLSIQSINNEERPNYPILFSDKETPHSALGVGWSAQESWGVWSDGPNSDLYLPIPESEIISDIEFTIKANAYAPRTIESQLIGVRCNGIAITLLKIKKNKRPKKIKIRIPSAIIHNRKIAHLQLSIQHPSSPAEEGVSTDNRRLGLGLVSVNVKKIRSI
ncbi:DUF7024 domain-containing protein [Pseudomonas fluorescens group sp. PF-1]